MIRIRSLFSSLFIFRACGTLALLAVLGSAAATPPPAAPVNDPVNDPVNGPVTATVVAHRYWLDSAGTATAPRLATGPFLPLPAWWHRDPPDVLRWERLDLRWQQSPESSPATPTPTGGHESILHLRSTIGSPTTVSYAADDPLCGHIPPRLVKEDTDAQTIGRWTVVPLCPGARTVFLNFRTTRDVGPLAKVRSGQDAAVIGFTSSANAYIVGMLVILSVLFGLLGTLRNHDLLWAGLLARSLLFAPYFLQHAAAPQSTAAALFARVFTGPAPDLLLATTALAHGLFLVGMLWTQTPDGWARRTLLSIPTGGLLAMLVAMGAPYPLGFYAALAVTSLALPMALGVAFAGARTSADYTTGPRGRWQRAALLAVIFFGSLNPLMLFHTERWRTSHISLLLFDLALAAWLFLRAAHRREVAATALLEEKWSRERADERAREQEERRLETRDLMLMLTHEVRTPLAVLQLSVDAAAKSPQARERVHNAIAEMDRLIERCLETARLDTETQADAIGDWEAQAAAGEAIARSRAPERVRASFGTDIELARTHPAVINAIIAILLDNALRYGATEADVTVDIAPAAPARPGILIDVVNAIGPFGPPDADRIFQKYYRGAGAHRQSGAGLGLYLASRLADRLGGEITHASTQEFTRFTLWIPR